MNYKEKIDRDGDELQVLAFNMLDELDMLNFHSGREAVRDLSEKVFGMADEMLKLIKDLLHSLQQLNRLSEMEEAVEMASMLEVMRHCSFEPASYQHFVSILIPLIKMLTVWSERGPVIQK
jgi:hypothetical protein